MAEQVETGWERWRPWLGLALGTLGIGIAAAILMNPPTRILARSGIVESPESPGPEEYSVSCKVLTDDSKWGAAPSAICQDASVSTLTLAGLAVLLAGVAMFILTARRRSGMSLLRPPSHTSRVTRLAGMLSIALGLSAACGGQIMRLAPDQVTPLAADDGAVAEALSDSQLQAAFEVVGSTRGRYEQERWWIVETTSAGGEDVAAVRDAIRTIEWSLEETTEDYSDGWVRFRGLAGEGAVDQVEVGLLRDALDPDADLSANSRLMLEEQVARDSRAVAVHLVPSPLA